jgi:hypothetical protein
LRYRDTQENTIVSITDEYIKHRPDAGDGEQDPTFWIPSTPALAQAVNATLDTLDRIHAGWVEANIAGDPYDRVAYRMDVECEQRSLNRLLGLDEPAGLTANARTPRTSDPDFS